ncbi:uncharacterized protein DAT39_013346 [Clarias magur]|uniref:Uncharacterized protein n=1 Tax=Clarias magur TaxID=1594786 RepID=A0A8J4TFW4_CLAMG|nr:uncharacterized protein DAT39_013346 [Clarias magur]
MVTLIMNHKECLSSREPLEHNSPAMTSGACSSSRREGWLASEIVHQRHYEKALSCTRLPKLSFKCGCGIKDRCIVSGINCLLAIWH